MLIEATPAAPTALDPQEVWTRVKARATTAASRAMLSSLRLVSLEGGRAVLAVEGQTGRAFAEGKAEAIARAFTETVGSAVRIEIAGAEQGGGAPARREGGGEGGESARGSRRESERGALEHPLVQRAVELFDASVVSVQEDTGPGRTATPSE